MDPQPKGLLVIQLDGTAPEVLRLALRRGPMPVMQRLLEDSHRLTEWTAGPPSQTSSSQAAILYGDDFDIPAFRWYEKEHRRMMVSNHPGDAAAIDGRAEKDGLLARNGSGVGNLLSGGASQMSLSMGTITRGRDTVAMSRWLLEPQFLIPELFKMIREVLREVGQATRQRLRSRRPRVKRGGSFPFLRAVSTVLLRDLTTKIVLANLRAAVPVIYATYVGYDVVAHHAGPSAPESLKVLADLDREIGRLLSAASAAARDYDVVILSDHGQSVGTPFRQRYRQPIEDVVRGLAAGTSVSGGGGTTETWGYLNEILSASMQGDRLGNRRVRRALRPRIRDGYVEVGPDRVAARPEPADLVVSVSGNLAHVYLATVPGRVPLELIREAHPGLIEGLIDHPGIEFVMGTSEGGPLLLAEGGSRNLADGSVNGRDPLRRFREEGVVAAERLARLSTFPHAGDLVLNSRVSARDGSVAAFEDLVGSHGGLGGAQTHAFVVAPEAWGVGDRLDDGRAVHELLELHVPDA